MAESAIDPRITFALEWCKDRGLSEVTLAVPFALSTGDARALLSRSEISALVLVGPSEDVDTPGRVGVFLPADYSWRLPTSTTRCLVYPGGRDKISARMIRAALRAGVRRIVIWDLDQWQSLSLTALFASRVREKLASLMQIASVRLSAASPRLGQAVETLGTARLQQGLSAQLSRPPRPLTPVPGRVVIACPTLVAGGAERQIVNTVLGLKARGFQDIHVLVTNLYAPPGNDFFLQTLLDAGVAVREVEPAIRTLASTTDGAGGVDTQIFRMLIRLPADAAQEVASLYHLFRELRPSVVHAWLDHSAVRAGLAALMAGVPRAILAGRNVSPIHFPYILLPLMRPAYRAMATRREVVFINNSRGGAEDYAAWLALGIDRFRILYNGLDPSEAVRGTPEQVQAFRARHGVPPDALLVGGMFRLSAEKRPDLWIDAMVRVVRERDDVYGLLFGAGPLQGDLERRLLHSGVGERVRLAPPTKESALALSAFDLLLLASRWEGTPNVAIEAQAVGTPVVVSGGGGAREALAPGVTGLFVEQASAPALADALCALLGDPRQRLQFAAAGPDFVAQRFGLERMITETVQLYGL